MTARHSTGVTEPVPAVEDDLLRELGERANNLVQPHPYRVHLDLGRDLLASEPMQRLRAAWTAEAAAESVRQAFELVKLRADNASLRAQVDGRLRDNDVAAEALKKAWCERDEAREEAQDHARDALSAHAEVERLRAELERWKAQDDATAEALRGCRHFGEAYESAIGRLRAAVPDLPDVGPVYVPVPSPVTEGYLACDGEWFLNRAGAAKHAAQALAVVREFDRLDREAEERAAARVTHYILDRHRQTNGEHVATCSCGHFVAAQTPKQRDNLVLAHLSERAAADTTTDDKPDEALLQALRQRDEAIDAADKLADALAGDTWIGEHTSENDPWQNALDAHRARTHGEDA